MKAIILVALAAVPAHAQPITHPDDTCDVSMVRAPDDVRDVVDDALENEHCTTPLEVRIVRTEGGLYLFARDPRGHIRERIVADAQAAAVLIASWASDDGIAGSSAPAWTVPAAAEPAAAPAPMHSVAPPGATLPTIEAADEPAPPPQRSPHKWLTAALLARTGRSGGGWGVRAAVDLWQRGSWTLGATAATASNRIVTFDQFVDSQNGFVPWIDTVDVRALVYGAHTWGTGAWHLRTSIGAGFVVTYASADLSNAYVYNPMPVSGTAVFPVAEASAVVGVDLSDDWGLDVGVVPALYAQTMHLTPTLVYDRSDIEWSVLGGLRHRL